MYLQQTRDGVTSTETAHINPVESQENAYTHTETTQKVNRTNKD